MNTLNTHKINTIRRSCICLNPVWGRSFEIVRRAEKLPESVRAQAVPTNALRALNEAYDRALFVLSCKRNAR